MAKILVPFADLTRKKKTVEAVLNIPSGLDVQYVRRAEGIPDSYIKKNFILEEHRGSRSKIIEGFPLFKTIIEQATGRQLGVESEDEYDEDEDEDRDDIDGERVKLEKVLMVLKNLLDSEATLALFTTAKIHYYPNSSDGHYADGGNIVPTEIIFCKEEISYESDATVINKLKKQVFAEITRYRRAKEKY